MKRLLIALLLAVSFAPLGVHALSVPPAPSLYVLDQAEVLSLEFENQLRQKLTTLENETTAEIGILTITSLEEEPLEPFALDVFREWGIGQKQLNNGVLILLAVQDHEVRIEVGYGLEGRITDAVSKRIINNTMVPPLQVGDYEMAVGDAVENLSELIYAESDEAAALLQQDAPPTATDRTIAAGFILLFEFLFVYSSLSAIQAGRRKKFQMLPILPLIGLISLYFMGATMLIWIIGAILLFFFQMVIMKSSFIGKPKDIRTGGRGSSSGSFGGFGGGSSGGGGASGKW